MKRIFTKFLLFVFFLISSDAAGQYCNAGVPTFNVNLTGSPDSMWISPLTSRTDYCCGNSGNDRCVQIILTLDPTAQGIIFDVCDGAKPSGAMYYQVNCGPQTAVGAPICLNGPGPHNITFCKPGANANSYCITSIPAPQTPSTLTVNEGCTGTLTATGFDPATITWNSITGTPGQYNSYLSCTAACTTTQVTAQPGYPSFVDYQVCGVPLGGCVTQPVCLISRVNFNSTLLASIAPVNPTICFGSTSTTITANGAGGSPPYNYQWSTGATTQSINVGPGTYTVIIGDTTDCPPTSATITVTQFASTITANAGADRNVCNLSPSTTLNGSVTGVTTGIWSGGNGSFIPNNTTLNATYIPSAAELAAGQVTLTLTTTNNGTCPAASDNVTIFYVPFQGNLTVTPTHVTCTGANNGSATANVAGTAGPYTYSWSTSPIQTTQTATGLAPGTYTVTVRDNISCPTTATVTITQPTPVTTSTTQTNVSCFLGKDGTATVTAFGGTPGYTYSWNTSPTAQTTASIDSLSAGTYIVTVRDLNNCTTRDTVIITQPTLGAAVITKTDVSCKGGSDGVLVAAASGGTPGYSYLWTPSGITNDTAIGLPIGYYVITVTDANGCQVLADATISQPADSLALSLSQTNVSCSGGNNGTATVVATGGTGPYTYSWNTTPVQTTATATNLPVGVYIVTVTDAKGCTSVSPSINITQPPILVASVGNFNNVSCFGGNDGEATVAVGGGTPGYTYSWNTSPVQTGATATGLTAGNYTVTVTDANGCQRIATISISQPSAALAATVQSLNHVTCFGGNNGSANLNITGGTPGYNVLWMPGALTGASQTGLTANTYTVTVSDTNNCQTVINVIINQPPAIVLVGSSVNATCGNPNGQASVSASGGTPGYTYSWAVIGGTNDTATGLPAGSYTVTVTDAIGCSKAIPVNVNNTAGPNAVIFAQTNVTCYGGNDGSATVTATGGVRPYTFSWIPFGGTDSVATGLTAGVYTATVTDVNGCKGLITTNPEITQPGPFVVYTTKTDVLCNGGSTGSATVNVSGNNPGYVYMWSPYGGVNNTTDSILTAGTYTVDIFDSKGCTTSDTVIINEPTLLNTVLTTEDVGCKGESTGSASILASGGTPNYSYLWAPTGYSFPDATGLSAGSYTITVTDDNGCEDEKTFLINEPAIALTANLTKSDVLCNGQNNGTATAVPAGGTPGYTYSWSPVGGSGPTASNLFAGDYLVTITDTNGCKTIKSITIDEPNPLTVTISSQENTFCGQVNGQASASVSGGTSSYSYSWSTAPVQTNPVAVGLVAGSYTVTVTDFNGCVEDASVIIIDTPGGVAAAAPITHVSCFGGNNGSAQVNMTGGVAPFMYSWSPAGGNNPIANGLTAGDYTVTVSDSEGCDTTATVTINEPADLVPSIDSYSDVDCFGSSTGSATADASGGVPGYTYTWNTVPTQTGATATNLSAGTYTVFVRDANSCLDSARVVIGEPAKLTNAIASQTDAICYGTNTGTASVNAFGGTPNYSYSWNTNPIQNTATATGLATGSYTVTITDAQGCQDIGVVFIDEPTPVITVASTNDTICRGSSTNISATGSGGSGSYFYVWDNGLGVGQNQNVAPQSTTSYIVTAYDLNGCPGNPDTVVVGIIKLDQANLFVGATDPICPGATTTVYSTVTDPAAGPLTVTWNNGLPSTEGPHLVQPTAPTYYTVSVTNSCGVTVKDSAYVDFYPLPVISAKVDTVAGCTPALITFIDLSTEPSGTNTAWEWNFGDGNTASGNDTVTHVYTTPGTYPITLAVTSAKGCKAATASTVSTVTINPVPVANFTPNPTTVYLPNAPVVLNNQSSGGITYEWNFGDGNTSTQISPQHIYSDVGNYTITLITTNQYGCKDTTQRDVVATSDIVFPTGFTPDPSGSNGGGYSYGDYSNNVFFPYTIGVKDFHLMIFNRWGELIFETFDIKVGWDGYYRGKICQQDVYVWRVFARFHDGREFNKIGDVTLLR